MEINVFEAKQLLEKKLKGMPEIGVNADNDGNIERSLLS